MFEQMLRDIGFLEKLERRGKRGRPRSKIGGTA